MSQESTAQFKVGFAEGFDEANRDGTCGKNGSPPKASANPTFNKAVALWNHRSLLGPHDLAAYSGMMPSLLPIIAFGFVSPWMLWGAAFAGAPIIIHLLHRQRYRETTWAAMRFLSAAIRKQSQRMRLEQWLLLAVRTAILLCIALALAEPTMQSLSALTSGSSGAPTWRILVVDASLSMNAATAGRSRLDEAKESARKLVQLSRPGDTWSLFRVGQVSPAAIIRRPTPQTDVVLRELDQITGLEESADWIAVLKQIEQQLKQESVTSRAEIYLLTDLQESNWRPADATSLAQLRQSLRQLGESRVSVMPTANENSGNTAVVSLQVGEGLHLTGKTNLVRAGLKRFGSGPSSTAIEFRVDDRLQETREVSLSSDGETVVDWMPVLSAGEHRLEARITEDSLPQDNRRRAVINVQDKLPVLLVNGKPSGEPWENATDLLRLALSPDAQSPFAPRVIPESELLSTPLAPYACVFLCNLALITDREARWLEDYLTVGGAVVITAGSQVRLEQYNQSLLAENRAILPAKLVEVAGDPDSKESSFEFDPSDFSHPILKPFQGNPNSGLELTKTFAYLRTEIPPDRGTQAALRFNTGDPVILTARYGEGRVVLITTSVDREWSTWAVWGHSFVPLMHEIVRYAAADRYAGRQLLVGQPLTAQVDNEAVRSAVMTLPDESTASLEVVQRQATFDQTLHSGFYDLRWGPPASRSTWFVVNVDPIESDPAAFDEKSFKSEFPEAAQWRFSAEGTAAPVIASAAESRTSSQTSERSWSRPLLLTAFLLLLVELGLAWKLPVGVMAFCAGLVVIGVQAMAATSTSAWELIVRLAILLAVSIGVIFWQGRGALRFGSPARRG